ncbi:MAG TPA: pyridoxal-phosphate dependent enzyme [Actinocrinis sp.]|jgi:1-aminocyclopropane-1-carboxylate deaminase
MQRARDEAAGGRGFTHLKPPSHLILNLPSPLEPLDDARAARRGVRILLKRDDLIHPDLPGNKWRKLAPNLAAARDQGHSMLLTFGGAFSNHLSATAAAGHYFGFGTVGVVRGEQHLPLNPVLAKAAAFGMRLTYLDRSAYRAKGTPAVLDPLLEEFGPCYVLPEGGSNALAVRGCAALVAEIAEPFDAICCAVGTGGTLAGIASALGDGRRAVGFAVLKGGGFLRADVAALQSAGFRRVTGNWSLETGFHGGGYAKQSPGLVRFATEFEHEHGVRLDPVYEAKMMLGLMTLVESGRFAAGSTVVALLA